MTGAKGNSMKQSWLDRYVLSNIGTEGLYYGRLWLDNNSDCTANYLWRSCQVLMFWARLLDYLYTSSWWANQLMRSIIHWQDTINNLYTLYCPVVDCGHLFNPEHGRVDTLSGTVFNSVAMYSCDVGYMLDGVSTRVCVSKGIWIPEAPRCKSKTVVTYN